MRPRALNPAALIALALTLVAPAAQAQAQAQTQAERMLAAAQQLRATAEQHKATLTPEARAEMLRQADEMEKSVRGGAAIAADLPPKGPTLADKLMAEYGRLEWLTPNGACAGYTLENFGTFRFSPQINDRDSHCRNAYGHYASYLRYAADPAAAEGAATSLFYYDAAARRAAGLPRRPVE